MRSVFGLIMILFAIAGSQVFCTRNDSGNTVTKTPPPVSIDSMLRCYRQSNPDSVNLRTSLLATWQWEYIKCYWAPENANASDYKNLSVAFKPNDSLEVKTNNQIAGKAAWRLQKTNDGYFTLSTTPLVPQLAGKVIVCANRVIFFDSYVDGCDNYFKRLE